MTQIWYGYGAPVSITGTEVTFSYDGSQSKNPTWNTIKTFVNSDRASIPPANAPLLATGAASAWQAIAVGSGLSIASNTLTATGVTIPTASLLGGTGSALTGVTVGSGLNLAAGTLTAPISATLVDLSSTQTISGVKTFSAAPVVPTQAPGTNTTQAASCAFVQANDLTVPNANLLGGNGTALSAVTVGSGLSFSAGTLTAPISGTLVDLGSTQTITGVKTFSVSPVVPTQTVGTNTTQVASCAFVLANGGGYTLPTATATVLGGVKIGTGITITSGVISAGSGAAEGGTSSMVAVIPSASYPASNTVDIGAKINAAVAAVGAGGVVKIYPVPGGYAHTTPIDCTNGANLEGVGMPVINSRLTSTQDSLTFGSNTTDTTGPVYAKNLKFSCNSQGRDGVRVSQGIQLWMENIMVIDSGRDGFHMETGFSGDYIECTAYMNIKVYHSGRNGFHIEAGSQGFSLDYINQTTFYNCNSRWSPNGNPLKIVVNASGPAHKVSEIEWINGELDSAGSSAADGVSMSVTNSGTIECVHFQGVAIEDAQTGAHAGYAINTDGAGTGSVVLTNCILYGFTGGNIVH